MTPEQRQLFAEEVALVAQTMAILETDAPEQTVTIQTIRATINTWQADPNEQQLDAEQFLDGVANYYQIMRDQNVNIELNTDALVPPQNDVELTVLVKTEGNREVDGTTRQTDNSLDDLEIKIGPNTGGRGSMGM